MREERADMFRILRITRDYIQLSTHCNGDNLDGSDHGDEDKVPINSIHTNYASAARCAILNYLVG